MSKRAVAGFVLAVLVLLPALLCAACETLGDEGSVQTASTVAVGPLSTSGAATTLGEPPQTTAKQPAPGSTQATTNSTATGPSTVTTGGFTTLATTGTTLGEPPTSTKPSLQVASTLGLPPQATTTTSLIFVKPTLDVVLGTGWNRYEDGDDRIVLAGPDQWVTSQSNWASGGTYSWGLYGGAEVRFRFKGTYFRYVAQTEPKNGVARIVLDGWPAAEVDLYSPTGELNQLVYTSPLLNDWVHEVVIEWTGTRNIAAETEACAISLDAIDVKGTLVDPK